MTGNVAFVHTGKFVSLDGERRAPRASTQTHAAQTLGCVSVSDHSNDTRILDIASGHALGSARPVRIGAARQHYGFAVATCAETAEIPTGMLHDGAIVSSLNQRIRAVQAGLADRNASKTGLIAEG